MFRKSLTDEQIELLRQYRKEQDKIELTERRGLTGKIIAVKVEFYKANVGIVYKDRFVKDINTSRSRQLDDIANEITTLLYPMADNAGKSVQRAYAEE